MPASLRHFENQGRRSDPEDYLLRRLQKDNRLDSRRKEPVGGQKYCYEISSGAAEATLYVLPLKAYFYLQ